MSWVKCKLGDLMTLKRGHDLPDRLRVDGDVPVVSSSGITGYHNEAKAEPPGVVTGRYGTLGEVFFMRSNYWPLNTALYVIDFKGTDPLFAFYFLKNALRNYKSDKAAVPGVDRNVLHALDVVAPDLTIQKRVSDFLTAYDELIENNRRRIALLEDAVQQLYNEWFVRFRFPGHEHIEIVDGVPEGWRQCELSDICSLRAGGTFKPEYQGQAYGDLPFIKVRDMNGLGNTIGITEADNWVTEAQCSSFKGKPFPVGTSIFAKIGEALRKNRVRLITRPTLIDNNLMGAVPKSDSVPPVFLYFTLRTFDFGGKAGGAAVPFLSAKSLSMESIVLPTQPLLSSFDEVAAPIFDQITCLQKCTVNLVQARDLLLPKLMNGEITV